VADALCLNRTVILNRCTASSMSVGNATNELGATIREHGYPRLHSRAWEYRKPVARSGERINDAVKYCALDSLALGAVL
jgi:hypothetical protein